MRATARWTVVAVGAVGATLLAGAPLAALGRVKNVGDAVALGVGLAVAMAGVAWAIWHTSEALTPPITTLATYDDKGLADLRKIVTREPAVLFGPFGRSVADLQDQLTLRWQVVLSLEAAVARDPRQAVLAAALNDARSNVELGRRTVQHALALMHAWQVRNRLRRARLHTLIGMLIVAVGVAVFLSATPEPPAKAAAQSLVVGPGPDAR
ncbi:hypothetical protein ACWEOZ_12365 [Actinoplanes sp. NPDC004185]